MPCHQSFHLSLSGQDDNKVGEKIPQVFQAFSRAINYTFHRLSRQKVNEIMHFICQRSFHSNSSNATDLSPMHTNHLRNSRAFVHLKPKTWLCCANIFNQTETSCMLKLKIFPEVTQNSQSFPCS